MLEDVSITAIAKRQRASVPAWQINEAAFAKSAPGPLDAEEVAHQICGAWALVKSHGYTSECRYRPDSFPPAAGNPARLPQLMVDPDVDF